MTIGSLLWGLGRQDWVWEVLLRGVVSFYFHIYYSPAPRVGGIKR